LAYQAGYLLFQVANASRFRKVENLFDWKSKSLQLICWIMLLLNVLHIEINRIFTSHLDSENESLFHLVTNEFPLAAPSWVEWSQIF